MAFRSSAQYVTATSGSSIPVPVPSGVATDDIILLAVSFDASFAGVSAWPSGFTALVSDQDLTADGHSYGLAWKRAIGADSGTYSVSISTTINDRSGVALAFSGRHTSNAPTHTNATNNNSNSSPVTVTATGLTASTGDDLCWIGVGDITAFGVATGWTSPSGFTEREEIVSLWVPMTAGTQENVSSGSTGDKSGTLTLSGNASGWGALLVRIPAAAGGGATTLVIPHARNMASLISH